MSGEWLIGTWGYEHEDKKRWVYWISTRIRNRLQYAIRSKVLTVSYEFVLCDMNQRPEQTGLIGLLKTWIEYGLLVPGERQALTSKTQMATCGIYLDRPARAQYTTMNGVVYGTYWAPISTSIQFASTLSALACCLRRQSAAFTAKDRRKKLKFTYLTT